MRLLVAALVTPLLAGCGSSEPPGVDFERPVSSVYSTIGAVDGRVDLEGLLKSPIVSRTQPDNQRLVFLLGADSAEHRGQVTFQFHETGEGRSRVTVDAEIPEVKASIQGQMKFLSEAKVEGLLARRLKDLARRMKDGGLPLAELDALDQAIAFTALALDPNEINRALDLAGNGEALAAAMERELAWSSDNASEWASADAAMDDARGADTWGEEATGVDAEGYEPEGLDASGTDALGEDPTPDHEWGAPTDY